MPDYAGIKQRVFTHRLICWIAILLGLIAIILSRKPHILEFAHYYLGAKYHREVQYTGLYNALSAAIVEIHGKSEFISIVPVVRDLESGNYIVSRLALQRHAENQNWNPKRWEEFKSDVFFIQTMLGTYSEKPPIIHWRKILVDHGYNAPPTYTAYVSIITNAIPLGFVSIHLLGVFDAVLILLTFLLIRRIFGFDGAVIAFVFFASALDMLSYVTWALFRFDWFFAIAIALWFLSRRKYLMSGIMWGISSSLRIFPGVIAAFFIVVFALSQRAENKRISGIGGFLFGGFLGAIAFIVISTIIINVNTDIPLMEMWTQFMQRISIHGQTFNIVNAVGLDRFIEVIGISTYGIAEVIMSIILAAILMWVLTRKTQKPEYLAVLSMLFIPIVLYISHYYYLMLVFAAAAKYKPLKYPFMWLILTNIVVSIMKPFVENYVVLLRWECISYSLALTLTPVVLLVYEKYKLRKIKLNFK